MDDIAVLRALAPEGESSEAARADALTALEARIDGASGVPAARPARARRRGVLALAGVGAAAAVVAGVLLVSSGPSAEPAAAAVLRHTAAVAATAGDQGGSTPGPGQFLYTKTERLELQEWAPGKMTASAGGVIPPLQGAFTSFNSWQEEEWHSAEGTERSRWVERTPQFLTAAEKSRWEAAGSPSPLEDSKSGFPGARIIELRPGVMDVEYQEGAGFHDFSALPTEPKALRLAIEAGQFPGLSGGPEPNAPAGSSGQVIAELWFILDQPNTTPEIRAAVFGALAEMPGIELNSDASDIAGRTGTAISYEGTGATGYGEMQPGKRVEYIFDPQTSAILGRSEIITDPAQFPRLKGIAAGTVWRAVANLGSGIVGSTEETPGERNGEPVATASRGPAPHPSAASPRAR